MKRAIVTAVLLMSGGVLFAQTVNEIPCWVVGSGGGVVGSLHHRAFVVLGQPVVGVSSSTGHWIRHGFTPCSLPPTGVEEGPPPTPAVYTLHQNSPNPFNPRTLLRYDVPAPGGHVVLKVYDVGGRHVCTLVDRVENPGSHQITWTGVDDDGHPVASGLYIAVLQTPMGRYNKKMALVR